MGVADHVESRALCAGPADGASPWVLNTLCVLCPFPGGERLMLRELTSPAQRHAYKGKLWVHTQELELLGVNLCYSVGVNRSVGGHAGESQVL